nr:GNAT family N-acetyltransferase [uncultured Actinoplanes sp.]
MAEAALLRPADISWTEALSRMRHDVYHLPEYVRTDAGLSGGTPVAFRYDDSGQTLLIPLILRAVPDTTVCDAVSPYGYPGPIATTADVVFWERAAHAMAALLGAQDVVTAFVRLHPLLPAPRAALASVGTVVHHGETVSIDLSQGHEEMWRQTHRSHRNQINKAKRAGVSVVFDDWDHFDAWIGTYHATMRRVGAAEFYFFGEDHFHRLRDALAGRAHLAVALAGDEMLGGNLFFEYDGLMHTHLQSTRDGPIFHADKLLYDSVRRWGRDRGNRIYHLGGGLGGAADSLFQYKAAFSAGRSDFHTWRVVTDPAGYAEIVGEPAPRSLAGRFPPYR